MTRTNYGPVSLDVPAGWLDRSTITLLGPQPTPVRTLTAKPVTGDPPNILMRREDTPGNPPTLEEFVETHLDQLRDFIHEFKVLDNGTLEIRTSKGPEKALWLELDYTVSLKRVRQIQVYFFAGGSFHVVVGTVTQDINYAKVREQMFNVVRSIEIDVTRP
jgi:hypothetical protein